MKMLIKLSGIIVLTGIILRWFEQPNGNLILSIGLLLFFTIKLIGLKGRILESKLHFFQFVLLILAAGAVILRYKQVEYAHIVLIFAILLESLIALKLKLNSFLTGKQQNALIQLLKRGLK